MLAVYQVGKAYKVADLGIRQIHKLQAYVIFAGITGRLKNAQRLSYLGFALIK